MKKWKKVNWIIVIVIILSMVLNVNAFAKETTTSSSKNYKSGVKHLSKDAYNKLKKVKFDKENIVYSAPRSYDLSDKAPRPGVQGEVSSCVGWAVAYACKTMQEKEERNWDLNSNNHLFSPSYIYNQLNGGANRGIDVGAAMRLVVEQGCATLATMPYNMNDYRSQPSQQARQEAANYKAKSWNTIGYGDIAVLKDCISRGNPVVLAVPMYPDFMKLRSSNPIWDDLSGNIQGYHAICAVGYDDEKNAVKIINSWGTNWGIGGYGWIDYSVLSEASVQGYVMTDIKESNTNNNIINDNVIDNNSINDDNNTVNEDTNNDQNNIYLKNNIKKLFNNNTIDKKENNIVDNNSSSKNNEKIIVYSSNTCPYCTKAKDYLRSKNISYEERNVSENPAWGEEARKVSGQSGIPVIAYKDKVIIGYNTTKIDELIDKYKTERSDMTEENNNYDTEEDATEEDVDVIEEDTTEEDVDVIEEDTTEEDVDVIEEDTTEEDVDVIEEDTTEEDVDVIEEDTIEEDTEEIIDEDITEIIKDEEVDTIINNIIKRINKLIERLRKRTNKIEKDLEDKVVNEENNNLIVYTNNDCPYSIQLEEYLNSKNIIYEERNVDENSDWIESIMQIINNDKACVPVTVYNDTVIIGFDKCKIEELISTINRVDINENIDEENISEEKTDGKMILYTAEWCSFCHKVKEYLESKNVIVEERDIEKNPEWAEEAFQTVGQGAIPITKYNDSVVIGYDVNALDELIELYNSSNMENEDTVNDNENIEEESENNANEDTEEVVEENTEPSVENIKSVGEGQDVVIDGENFNSSNTTVNVCSDEGMCFKTTVKKVTKNKIILENTFSKGKYNATIVVDGKEIAQKKFVVK